MDPVLQELQDAHHRMVAACAAALEAKEAAGGERTERTDKALNTFLESHQLFHGACDRAQEFVESVRQRIGSECLVDEATGPLSTKGGGGGDAATKAVGPLSAVRLEQLSKAVRWLVIDLQHSAGAGSSTALSNTNAAIGQGAVAMEEV